MTDASSTMTPGRWWRVVYSDGRCYTSGSSYGRLQVWCETSDEDEARDALATCPGGGVLHRLYEQVRVTREWKNVP